MKVYTKFISSNGVSYRWGTVLQFGNSWDIIGSVVMKNPGSSKPKKDSEIRDRRTLKELDSRFGSSELSPWYGFTPDKTMFCVGDIFAACSDRVRHREELQGVILLFNVFYAVGADLDKVKLLPPFVLETSNEDIDRLHAPVYLGFGDLWTDPKYNLRCRKFYDKAISLGMRYFAGDFSQNSFIHPLRLIRVHRNGEKTLTALARFKNNSFQISVPKDTDVCRKPYLVGGNQDEAMELMDCLLENFHFSILKQDSNKMEFDIGHGMTGFIVAKKSKGIGQYVAFRHKDFDPKDNYLERRYNRADSMSSFLSSLGYITATPAWVGQKYMIDFYCLNVKELADKIMANINSFTAWLESTDLQ